MTEKLEIIVKCCVCQAIRMLNSAGWVKRDMKELYRRFEEKYKDAKVSHGYCPECYEGEKRKFEAIS